MKRLLLIVCLATYPAAAQTTRLAPADAARLPGMIEAELEVLGAPIVRAESIRQVVSFSIDHDFLSASTELKLPPGQTRVLVEGLRGVVRMGCFGFDDPEVMSRNFSYIQNDLTDPAAGQVITSVSAVAGRLNLARDAELEGTWHGSIQLMQDPPTEPGALPDEDPVRLIITRTGADPGPADVNIKVSAPSFSELRRRHGEIVDAYLRPIIRDFGQESAVFGVPDAIAWQVLGANYAPDATATAAVEKIVARLDADQFRQRVSAMNELRALGQPAAVALAHMDRSRFSLQQNSAIDTFLAEFAPLGQTQSRSLATDVTFLLDVLYTDDAALRQLALDQLSAVVGSKIELDRKLNAFDRGAAIDRLRTTLRPTTRPATQPG